MSVIAGRLAPQAGSHYLETAHRCRGVLLGGEMVHPAVAQALGLSPVDPEPLLAAAWTARATPRDADPEVDE